MNNSKGKLVLVIAAVAIYTCYTPATGQEKEIRIGDSVPDVWLSEIVKHASESATLSEFRDKAILIDFWFTTCVACIAKFPFLDSISKEYKDDLHILQVTRDSRQKVMDFYTGSDRWKHIYFPCVVNDTVMNQLFPHRTEPHYVWVGKDGVVKAITDSEPVTRENLSAFLEGRPFEAKLKEENRKMEQYRGLYPLMLDYPEIKNDLLSYSFFAKSRDDGFRAGVREVIPIYDTKENYYRLKQLGTTFSALYGVAYGLIGTMDFHPSRIVWETTGNERYEPDFRTRENVYDYDLIVRDTSKVKFSKYMQADLDKYFGVKSSFEKREIDVLVLRKTGTSDAFVSKDTKGFREQYALGDEFVIKNIPMFNVLSRFNRSVIFPFQVLNETGYNGQITINYYRDVSDMEKVRKSFQESGLDLVLEKREMDVIVIRD